jgi:hypothetical protein
MRYRTTHASEAAPVRIWVDLCCSTAVDKTNFAKVMAVLASGVIAIAEHRPIELMAFAALGWPSSSGDAWIITSPIDVQSLDARSLAVWCDPSVGRTAILPLHTACGGSSYDKPFGPGTGENRIKRIRAILGVEPDDIVLPPLFGADGQQAIAKRMVELMVKTGVECNVDEVIRSINSINSSNEHAPTKTAPKPRRRRRRF